jgi:uncharacterized protein (DUF433 family)
MDHQLELPVFPSGAYTVAEAAFVVDADHRFINREIDAHVVAPSNSGTGSGARLVARSSLLYFAAVRDVRTTLDTGARKDIYRRVLDAVAQGRPDIEFGAFRASIQELTMAIQPRLGPVDALRDAISIHPDIGGGEPVLKGTRLKVRVLADMVSQGVTADEIHAEFDVSKEFVNLAVLYDRLYPRRGRPPTRKQGVREHVPFAG